MTSLTFWTSMDRDFMWRWHCFDGKNVAMHSTESYFNRSDAEIAIAQAKRQMIQALAS
ncbi:hypothetical protein SAMN05216557_101460 [Sphingomonas carotinifaciens]|uniref:DUF1508 domain-containing protein n=2 Tax=Sphingomonadaceae TaxID=41297 RepID=A0A1G7FLL8_9SPHN|nr:hypothetical protein [Sphingomonas carotinifaciens]SDE76792.1 hypothetical protein SAMN05216557_101460 [Sphingomonas carotinifaciens]